MIRFSVIIPVLITLIIPLISYSQTISEKKFKKPGEPVFVANGFVNFSAALRNQSSTFENRILPDGFTENKMHSKQEIGNDTQIFLKSGMISGGGVKYGAVAKVEFNFNSDHRDEHPNLDQVFIYSEGDFGQVEFGNFFAVNQKMKVGPASFARGAGGINGKYLENVNLPMFAGMPNSNTKLPRSILLAQSPIGHGGYAKSFYRRGADNNYVSGTRDYSDYYRSNFRALKDNSFDGMEDAVKISYYSPVIEGFQLGLSYTPNSNNEGITSQTARDLDLIRIENISSFGLNYHEDFDNVGIAISATAENGQIKNSKSLAGFEREDLFAYDFGASASYFGFTLGASYGSWGDSLQPKNGIYEKFSHASYYTFGLAYQFGPIATSITSLKSSFQKNDYEAISLGLDYKLSRDFMPYFEITNFTFKSNQTTNQITDNRGQVFLTGILYSF